jgi:Acetyl-coenzyme A transporter 1
VRRNLLDSEGGRRWLFTLLYLSEGAPIGLIWWAMPTLLRSAGAELDAITTLTAVATLPWTLKFVLGPLLDAGLHRGIPVKRWILVCQLGMAASLLLVGRAAVTAGSTLIAARLGDARLAALFSLFMAMTNACEAWSAFVGGRFADRSYGGTLLSLAAVACIAVVPLVILLRDQRDKDSNEQTASSA